MPTEAIIRPATMDDCADACRLLEELDEHHVRIRPDVFQSFDDPIQRRERVRRFVNGDDAALFVAEISGRIVGLATVRVLGNPNAPMFRPGQRANIDDLVVNREFRGLGIAKKLLERVAQWAQSRALPCLVINVWNDNEVGASFFAKNGFSPRCQQMDLQI